MSSSSFRGSLLLPVLALGGAIALMACGDDGGTGGLGGQAGSTSPASSGAGNTKTTSAATTASTSAASGSTTATSATTATTASTSDAASSSSTGVMACMGVELVSVSNAVCDAAGNLALSHDDNVACTDLSDPTVFPLRVFALTVAANDCVRVRVTNVLGATLVSDLMATVIDPDGGNHVFEDDVDCIPGNGDALCPEGGLTMPAAGTAHIAVGAYALPGSPGCSVGGNTDYQISVSVNGTDFDIGTAPLCAADLNDL